MATQVKFPEVEARKNLNADGTPIEPTSQKFWRKLKEQPLVPIGSLATCGALIAASHYLRKGDRNQFQRALRWRVGLQGLTVVAAVIGTVYLGSGTPATVQGGTDSIEGTNQKSSSIYQAITTSPGRPVTVQQMERAEERKEQERQILQQRLREAEVREENEQKRRAEEALLRPSNNSSKQRPVIGQDKRDRSMGTHNS